MKRERRGRAHVPMLACEWIPMGLLVTSVWDCLQGEKNRLFWQKSGLGVWNQGTLPCCFASGRLSRSVRNKLSSIASCGQHKTDAGLAWDKLAIKISSTLFSVCGEKRDCAKMCRFTAQMEDCRIYYWGLCPHRGEKDHRKWTQRENI